MSRDEALVCVEAEARRILGDRASEWMTRPSKLLDGLAPAELATSPEGARVVLHELRQESTLLKAARSRKRARAA